MIPTFWPLPMPRLCRAFASLFTRDCSSEYVTRSSGSASASRSGTMLPAIVRISAVFTIRSPHRHALAPLVSWPSLQPAILLLLHRHLPQVEPIAREAVPVEVVHRPGADVKEPARFATGRQVRAEGHQAISAPRRIMRIDVRERY